MTYFFDCHNSPVVQLPQVKQIGIDLTTIKYSEGGELQLLL